MYSVLLSVDTAVFISELTYLWTAMCSHLAAHANGVFESCLIDRIYELNAHERHHKVVVKSEKTCRMQWTQPRTRYAVFVLIVNLLKLIKLLILCHVK